MQRQSLIPPRPSWGARGLTAASLLVLGLTVSVPLAAQEPELYRQALAELAAGDTMAALARLRELTDAEPNYAPGWGMLGTVLGELASGRETDFQQRLEADRALRKAWQLDPEDPSYLLALGQLMRKQQMPFDARRVLNRAKEAIRDAPESVTPEERAHLWYELGLYAEDLYLDTNHLTFVPTLPIYTPECGSLGNFCLNFTRPKEFNEYFRHAGDLSEEGEDDYEELMDAFRNALEVYPSHSGAFRRISAHLVERNQYREAKLLALEFQKAAPDDPWGYLTLGLVYQLTGADSLAEAQFDKGIELAGPDIADHYLDVSYVLRENLAEQYQSANAETRRRLEEVLWRKSDPLYLSPGNEIRVSHLARVTFADIWFEDPSQGRWGADTERGQIFVRYGRPVRIWQVARDASRTGGAEGTREQGGGRWIFWNYGWELPNFIFEKQLRYRHASHMMSSASKLAEEDAREAEPAVYSTSFELFDYPVQIARFRGAADSIVEVDFYSEIPGDSLLSGPDTLDIGLFLFAGAEHVEVFRRVLTSPSQGKPQALTFTLPLPPGRFTYSLEAEAPLAKAAVHRGELETRPFRDDSLALSDLLLANAITPRGPEPLDRRGFAIRVNRQAVFDRDLPVAVYWEVYGLATDSEGYANYRVRLSVTDAQGKGVLARVADAFGFGEGDEVELTFERVVEFNGVRVPEYMSLELLDSEPGPYRISIEITDLIGERTVVGERDFQLVLVPG
jgi:GWxTD domain-containing protein